jgi:RNA polymerase-binding protein DksA
MARSTRKSLAGSAAAAAKKVIGRRGATKTADAGSSTPKATAAKKAAPAKKATPAKATVAKKGSTMKKSAPAAKKAAPAKKAAAKKALAKTVAKKVATAKAVATAPVAKKAPAKRAAPAKKTAPTKKTAPAKKAPISSLAVKEGEDAWTKADVKEVLTELHSQRDKLVKLIEDAEHDLAGLMRDAGDGAGHDQADMGATSFERDHELTVVNNERDMVAQIDRALARIHDGTYGVCESCGQPIGKMRLMAFPRATLCMSCKQREERR